MKLGSDMRTLSVTPAELTGYQQYPGSDCLNGAVLRVADGYGFVESTPSHHVVLVVGDVARRLQLVAEVWGLEVRKAPALARLPST